MQRNLVALADTGFDLLVIGGGITGAFLAHDAVLRGLSVALVEKDDFGGFTSSASSKLLHGGVRYLPKGQVWKVRESYREAAIFQHIAPHLTRWLPFLIPTQSGSLMKGEAAMRIAMELYGLCSLGLDNLIADPGKRPPRRAFLGSQEVRAKAPLLGELPGLTGAQILWESHMHNSERMTLAVIKTAVQGGAQVANYCAVKRLLSHGDQVTGALVQDRLSGQEFPLKARFIINAAGPHVQAINQSLPGLQLKRRVTAFSKGAHLVTKPLAADYALALTTGKKLEGIVSRGGRHCFIIPWRDRSLIGTTNVPFTGSLDEVRVTATDITDFLDDINSALPGLHLTPGDVHYSFCGLYPLIAKDVQTDTYQGTGEYQVIDHQQQGVQGMLTVLGAKYTTARWVAEKGMDLAMNKLGYAGSRCQTASRQLVEGAIGSLRDFQEDCRRQYGHELPQGMLEELCRNHGLALHRLIAAGRQHNLLQPVAGSDILAIEIDHAIREEMAVTLDDLVFRRTGLGTIGRPDAAALEYCASRMASALGWSEDESKQQLAAVHARYEYV